MNQKLTGVERENAQVEGIRKKLQPHSLKVQGIPALRHNQVVAEEEVFLGDCLDLFVLQDGRYLVSKTKTPNSDSLVVERITTSHIFFEEDLDIKEV